LLLIKNLIFRAPCSLMGLSASGVREYDRGNTNHPRHWRQKRIRG
jgi:hypothetical protein